MFPAYFRYILIGPEALMVAASKKFTSRTRTTIANRLLEACHVDPHAWCFLPGHPQHTQEASTPFLIAVRTGNVDLVRRMLEASRGKNKHLDWYQGRHYLRGHHALDDMIKEFLGAEELRVGRL